MKAKLYLSSAAVAISMLLCNMAAMSVSAASVTFAYTNVPVGENT